MNVKDWANPPSNRAREQRISEIMGEEERRRVQNALSCAAEARQERDVAGLVESTAAAERERCARLCETFAPNLLAKHLAQLIRKGV